MGLAEGKAAATGEVVRVEETEAAEKGGATVVAAMTVATGEVVRVVQTVAAMAVATGEEAATVEEVKAVAAAVMAAVAAARKHHHSRTPESRWRPRLSLWTR